MNDPQGPPPNLTDGEQLVWFRARYAAAPAAGSSSSRSSAGAAPSSAVHTGTSRSLASTTLASCAAPAGWGAECKTCKSQSRASCMAPLALRCLTLGFRIPSVRFCVSLVLFDHRLVGWMPMWRQRDLFLWSVLWRYGRWRYKLSPIVPCVLLSGTNANDKCKCSECCHLRGLKERGETKAQSARPSGGLPYQNRTKPGEAKAQSAGASSALPYGPVAADFSKSSQSDWRFRSPPSNTTHMPHSARATSSAASSANPTSRARDDGGDADDESNCKYDHSIPQHSPTNQHNYHGVTAVHHNNNHQTIFVPLSERDDAGLPKTNTRRFRKQVLPHWDAILGTFFRQHCPADSKTKSGMKGGAFSVNQAAFEGKSKQMIFDLTQPWNSDKCFNNVSLKRSSVRAHSHGPFFFSSLLFACLFVRTAHSERSHQGDL